MGTLPTPVGDDIWGEQLNEAVETLTGFGAHSARPAANSVAPASLYACSDHSLIYRSDGSSWSTFASQGVANRRSSAGPSETSYDEFQDDVLNPAWIRVDPTATVPTGNVTYTEGGGVLSILRDGPSTTNSSIMQSLMLPLSSVGGAMAAGDAFITCMTIMAPSNSNIYKAGVTFSDGVANTGNQIHFMGEVANVGPYIVKRVITATTWGGGGSTNAEFNFPDGASIFMRLVYLGVTGPSVRWRWDTSPDGISWMIGTVYTIGVGWSATHVGFSTSRDGVATQPMVASFDFLRRVSGVT